MTRELSHKSLSIQNIWRKANLNKLSKSACLWAVRLVNKEIRELVSPKALRRSMLQSMLCFFVDRRKALSTLLWWGLQTNEAGVFFRRSPKGVEHMTARTVWKWQSGCFFVDRRKALSTRETI